MERVVLTKTPRRLYESLDLWYSNIHFVLKILNICFVLFCFFLGINFFEVVNTSDTAYEHFSTSCTWCILGFLKTETRILETEITCADGIWGF